MALKWLNGIESPSGRIARKALKWLNPGHPRHGMSSQSDRSRNPSNRPRSQTATARGHSPPGAGGGIDGGADRGAGSPRETQHVGIRGRGRAVAAANFGVDMAGGTRDGDSEGGA